MTFDRATELAEANGCTIERWPAGYPESQQLFAVRKGATEKLLAKELFVNMTEDDFVAFLA